MSHIEPFRTDRREIPWRAVAVRDESILDLPPNHPLPNGHLWDSMGIYGRQQTHTICGSLVSKVLRMVRCPWAEAIPRQRLATADEFPASQDDVGRVDGDQAGKDAEAALESQRQRVALLSARQGPGCGFWLRRARLPARQQLLDGGCRPHARISEAHG